MYKVFFSCLAIIVSSFQTLNAQCEIQGWASQNGGVTGGGANTATVVSTYTELKSALTNNNIKVIHVSGVITFPNSGKITINSASGKSLLGLPGARLISTDMTTSGSGLLVLKNSSNIVIRNLIFEGPGAYDVDGGDNLTIDNSTNIWIDHCQFEDSIDGNLDIKNGSNYITVSWTKFQYLKPPTAGGSGGSNDHRFSNLFGSSDGDSQDNGKLKITMQYCWWGPGVRERMPRVRYGQVHLLNNYFNSSVSNYCIYGGYKADVLVEGNYFEGVKNPIRLETGNFTAVSSVNNIFSSTSGTMVGSGTAFTPSYTYNAIPASEVKQVVMNGAGPNLTASSPCFLAVNNDKYENSKQVSIYPNPATNHLTVSVFSKENNAPVEISVIDVTGKNLGLIYEGVLKNGQNVIKDISIKKLNKGVKFLQIKTNDDVYVQKVIVN